jgi:hypothetical protein
VTRVENVYFEMDENVDIKHVWGNE